MMYKYMYINMCICRHYVQEVADRFVKLIIKVVVKLFVNETKSPLIVHVNNVKILASNECLHLSFLASTCHSTFSK